jgi:hypothetical protein
MDQLAHDGLSGMSREMLIENINMETAENNRLRVILLELASRPEITTETRAWLATKIREKGKEPVVRGLREDEMDLVQGLRKWAGKLADHTQAITSHSTEGGPAYAVPSSTWYAQADSYAEQVQHFIQECGQQFGRCITDLEEGK